MDTQTGSSNGSEGDFDNNQSATAGSNDKQQIVGYLQNAKNVLITVSSDPSVDELAAALGLTFLLNRLDKHATTVFSGKIPAAMEFLDPEKTFEDNVDSLRDFIIALDKEKADKLRYKVEEDVVRIFITPYKTTLKKDDFEFSQGDFNVDVVVALGVSRRDDLDKSITAHGRILHDATVLTINTVQSGSLGIVDLFDNSVSSISEIIVGMSEALGSGLLDEQSSTALLTGIVAATNRFSNDKTSPKVMTMAAQLMAAGANQQLIASNLRHEGVISEEIRKNDGDSSQPKDDGELSLDHSDKKSNASKQGDKNNSEPGKSQKKQSSNQKQESKVVAEDKPEKLSDEKPSDQANAMPPIEIPKPENPAAEQPQPAQQPGITPIAEIKKDDRRPEMDKPSFGGTLNATTSHAEEAKIEEARREAEVNQIALSHDAPQPDAEQSDALEAARRAVEEAADETEFDPANQPIEAINAMPIENVGPQSPTTLHPVSPEIVQRQMTGPVGPQPAPTENIPDPMDAFMNPHTAGVKPPEQQIAGPTFDHAQPTTSTATPAPSTPDMTSLPPLPPPLPNSGALPPLPQMPPMPGQVGSPAANFQPQTSPDFMQAVNQSQNSWTEAGQNLAAQQASKDAVRQEKMDQMTQQYDAAVDKNRELQGLPPVNNSDHSVFPLPPNQ